MVSKHSLISLLLTASTASASLLPRTVSALDETAFKEAHPRDNTATRAFSGIHIKTSSGKCLFVNKLSGDFRANLNPIQFADCGSTDGQAWDVITSGVHDNVAGEVLLVNTLTQACVNFDPRRMAGDQVIMFSCGGRADGSGSVTDSQLFAYSGGTGPLALKPGNGMGMCLTGTGDRVGIAACDGKAEQKFTFAKVGMSASTTSATVTEPVKAKATKATATKSATGKRRKNKNKTKCSARRIVTVTNTVTVTASLPDVVNPEIPDATTTSAEVATETIASTSSLISNTASATSISSAVTASESSAITDSTSGTAVSANPTAPVPVSGAGGTLNPSAAAEANAFDATAVRALQSVNIRASDGRCLSVDPTAGDFRENLIPVALATCNNKAGQKFDIVTRGKHDDGTLGEALVVSVLMNGCLSFDGRRAEGDTVNMFSCGGRADGSGQTNTGQLYPFNGTDRLVLEPASENNQTCLIAGDERLVSGACTGNKSQVFELVEVLQSEVDLALGKD